MLKRSPRLNYAGNVEGRDILPGPQRRTHVDVVVCDGFVGNVVLKFYEAAGKVFVGLLHERAPDIFERPALRELVSLLDYSDVRRRAAAGRQGRVHHLPRILQPERHQERYSRGPPGRPVGPQRTHRRRIRAARVRGALMIPRPFAEVASVGVAVPPGVLTNADLTRMLDTSDEWIVERTGIRERHIARPEQTVAQLSQEASLRALAAAGTTADELDAIVLATASPDRLLPSTAVRPPGAARRGEARRPSTSAPRARATSTR